MTVLTPFLGLAAPFAQAKAPSLLSSFFDLETFSQVALPLLTEGMRVTLVVSFGAFCIGILGGLILGLLGVSDRWFLRWPARLYVDLFRGLPAVVTISLIGLGVPLAMAPLGGAPWGRNQMVAAILALGMICMAYCAEIFRAGIQAVDRGQSEAARSLGMTAGQTMRLIVIPQAFRKIIPPLTNEFIAITKDSSLVFVLGLAIGGRDLYRVGSEFAQQTGNYSAVVAAGLCYLLITIPMTRLANRLEQRLNPDMSPLEKHKRAA